MSDTHELVIERLINAPVSAVWKAWTDHLEEWWCPKPWRTEIVEQDLRPGGRSAMVMRGPEGEAHPMEGVILEVVPERSVVFTDAFTKGWKPAGPFMVGFFELMPQGDKTHYRAGARHWTAEAKAQHEAMGFIDGWTKVAEQLEEVAKRLAA